MSQHSEQLAALLNSMRAGVRSFYAGLPENERFRSGTWEVWAPKDVLAHITFWQNTTVAVLQSLDSSPPEQSPFEERNHANFLATNQKSWEEINAAYEKSLDQVLEGIGPLSEMDLTDANRFPRTDGAPLQSPVLGNCYNHTSAHLAELIGKYVGADQAQLLQEQVAEKIMAFDPSPRNRGTALYNLACFYALDGSAARAVELLQQAFQLRPDLVEWSKQDTDFDRIRNVPEFQALFS